MLLRALQYTMSPTRGLQRLTDDARVLDLIATTSSSSNLGLVRAVQSATHGKISNGCLDVLLHLGRHPRPVVVDRRTEPACVYPDVEAAHRNICCNVGSG